MGSGWGEGGEGWELGNTFSFFLLGKANSSLKELNPFWKECFVLEVMKVVILVEGMQFAYFFFLLGKANLSLKELNPF